MPRVAVFVSHSSKDADLTDALCAHLLAPDDQGEQVCDVVVDKTHLLAGTEWPKQLHEFMAKCHAAVILLTGVLGFLTFLRIVRPIQCTV